MLAGENLLSRARQIKPPRTIDLRKALSPPAFRRPFHFEGVARNRVSIQICFDRKGYDALPDLTQSPEGLSASAELFPEFASRHMRRILAWLDFSFRDRPGAAVLVAPASGAPLHACDFFR